MSAVPQFQPSDDRPSLRVVTSEDDLPARVGFVTASLKRTLDITVALSGLIVLSPLLIAIAAVVRLTSKGPAFFRQTRLGRHERPFTILKFRSMRVDAPQTGPGFTQAGDPRITPIGRLLHKTSLDELPQLINVLRGDMSLVGPRPYIGFELESWSAEERAVRAAVRPGITGLAQVSGRSQNTAEKSRRCDLDYVANVSVIRDIQIIALTGWQATLGRGTN